MTGGPDRPLFLGGPPEPATAPATGPAPRDPRTPGEPGLWVFLLGDMTVFAAFFVGVLVYRHRAPEVFRASVPALSVGLGTLDTIVLLTSSLLMVAAVAALRRPQDPVVARRLLLGVVACAVVFALLKATEYVRLVDGGHDPQTNVYFTLYFALTGIHLLHLVVGTVAVVALIRISSTRPAPLQHTDLARGVASYWHMVDLLWVVLFPLLYLVSRS